jgi:hypothetical protein
MASRQIKNPTVDQAGSYQTFVARMCQRTFLLWFVPSDPRKVLEAFQSSGRIAGYEISISNFFVKQKFRNDFTRPVRIQGVRRYRLG